MKILFHVNSMGRGGAERVVSIFSHFLAEKGHEVVITTLWYSEEEYEIDKRVKRISVGLTEKDDRFGRVYRAWKRLCLLRKTIRTERPDIVISFCNKANFRSAISLFGMSTPLLVSVRNDPQVDYAPHKIATKYMEYKVAGCVFQTPDAQKFFSEKLQKKSRVIFNPISEEYLAEEEIKCGEKVRKHEIVTVGRISRQKNQMLLVKAFADLCEKYSDYVLKIYGASEEEPFVYEELSDYVQNHGLQEKVLFMGRSNSIKHEIENVALFVLSSDYEGMPNALIEAMVIGLPSISTDCPCGGSAMLIDNFVSGLLVPVGDKMALQKAMDYMLQNGEHAEQMGREAKKVIERVHPHKICEEWAEFIEEVIKK